MSILRRHDIELGYAALRALLLPKLLPLLALRRRSRATPRPSLIPGPPLAADLSLYF